MGTRQVTPFFHLVFMLFLTFISELENIQNSLLCGTPFASFWSVKYILTKN